MIHSRWTSLLSGTIAAAGALLVAACGSSSTSPKGQTAAQVAAYYDALAGTHLAAGTFADTIDAEFIGLFNGPIAYGQLPAKVAISASGASQSWYGNAVELIDSAGTDSVVVGFLWADTVVSSFILFEADTILQDAQFYTSADASSSADSSTVKLGLGTKSSACATNITITHTYAAIPTYDPAGTTCTPATFTIAGHLHFGAQSGIASQFQDVDVSSTTLSGVRLQLQSGTGFSRVRALPHAILRAR